jgi:hypothetical protein
MKDRFARSLKMLNLGRVLRPLRALSVIPQLRSLVNAVINATRDLGSTLVLIAFCITVFGIFATSLLSGNLRYRCYDQNEQAFYEPRHLICSRFTSIGRQCPRPGSICVDSGFGPYAHLEGTAPHYLAVNGHQGTAFDSNPPGVAPFDSFGWSLLACFVVWAGVGWTTIMYLVTDSAGQAYEGVFMLMHMLGAWFLVNLMVAVLGASFEREAAKQELLRKEQQAVQEKLLGRHLTWKDRLKHSFKQARNELMGVNSFKDGKQAKASRWQVGGSCGRLSSAASSTSQPGNKLANLVLSSKTLSGGAGGGGGRGGGGGGGGGATARARGRSRNIWNIIRSTIITGITGITSIAETSERRWWRWW